MAYIWQIGLGGRTSLVALATHNVDITGTIGSEEDMGANNGWVVEGRDGNALVGRRDIADGDRGGEE